MSALATVVGSIGELTESELRQLYLMIGVRLGIPDVSPGVKPQKTSGGKSSSTKPSVAKGGKKAPSSKGNPKRKSQWANHPLYQEYSRLKKVVETQAKESKLSFNAVDTPEGRAYKQAFSDWLEAKSSFRDHSSGQTGAAPAERKQDEEESSEEEDEGAPPSSSPVQPVVARPPPAPKVAGKSSGSSGRSGFTRSSPGKGEAPSK
jgi:hypothetical protein